MTGVQPLTRSDLLLILRPIVTAEENSNKFSKKAQLTGLVLAALFFASIQIPTWIAYNQAGKIAENNTVIAQSTPDQSQPITPAASPEPEQRSQLNYDALTISSPITWKVENNNTEIQRHLQNGLVHLLGSAEPGQRGTVILTGHSSNFLWAKGEYKTIFAPLLRAQIGDTFTITHQQKNYSYRVTEVYEVDPSRLELLDNKEDVAVRLITCTPLGSAKRRLIVDAVQTSPEYSSNSTYAGSVSNVKALPTAR